MKIRMSDAMPLASRRAMLRAGSLAFFGFGLSDYLRLQAASGAKAQSVILVWLNGGPSHVDTWDPKPNSSFRPISTNVAGIQVSELLPRCSRLMDKLSIVRSVHTEENNHGIAHHYALTGHRPSPAMKFPSLGSIIANEMGERESIPPYVVVPKIIPGYEEYFRAQMLGARLDPMNVPDPNQKDFRLPDLSLPESVTMQRIEGRRAMLRLVDQMYRERLETAEHASADAFQQQALQMILSPKVRAAFDLSREPDQVKDAYGRTTFGQSALMARRLIEAGSRFVTVFDSARSDKPMDWDTHSNNDKGHRDVLVPALDQVLSALVTDLDGLGLLASTIVLAMGEFGRTPDINPNGGRDHWNHCWSLVMGGGGIRGGTVVGASDERGGYVKDRLVSMGDIFATLYKALGIDWTKEYMHPVGRPLKIANSIDDKTGSPLGELI
jgi:uncharacterized protein (DUF1501 family)